MIPFICKYPHTFTYYLLFPLFINSNPIHIMIYSLILLVILRSYLFFSFQILLTGPPNAPRLVDAAVPILYQLLECFDLYLLSICSSKQQEDAILAAFTTEGILPSSDVNTAPNVRSNTTSTGGLGSADSPRLLKPNHMLFCMTTLGKQAILRQIEPSLMIDCTEQVVTALRPFIDQVVYIPPPPPPSSSSTTSPRSDDHSDLERKSSLSSTSSSPALAPTLSSSPSLRPSSNAKPLEVASSFEAFFSSPPGLKYIAPWTHSNTSLTSSSSSSSSSIATVTNPPSLSLSPSAIQLSSSSPISPSSLLDDSFIRRRTIPSSPPNPS